MPMVRPRWRQAATLGLHPAGAQVGPSQTSIALAAAKPAPGRGTARPRPGRVYTRRPAPHGPQPDLQRIGGRDLRREDRSLVRGREISGPSVVRRPRDHPEQISAGPAGRWAAQTRRSQPRPLHPPQRVAGDRGHGRLRTSDSAPKQADSGGADTMYGYTGRPSLDAAPAANTFSRRKPTRATSARRLALGAAFSPPAPDG